MSQLLYRASEAVPPQAEGHEIRGIAVPYGRVATVSDGGGRPYKEMFAPRSFARSIEQRGNRVRLWVGHDNRRLPIGRAVELVEHQDGLHVVFEVPETTAGLDAIRAVNGDLVGGMSVGFKPIRHRIENGVVVRTENALREISLVGDPAYPDAVVTSARDAKNIETAWDLRRRRFELLLK